MAVVGFEHMHAGDQISVINALPNTGLIGVFDGESRRMDPVCDELGIAGSLRFHDLDELVAKTAPQIAVVCSSTADHVGHVQYFAARGIHVLLEKPLAPSLEDAKIMVASAQSGGIVLGVNWPLAWYPSHRTAKRLISDGSIGAVTEIHYYDGNRGPLFHTHGKQHVDAHTARVQKDATWWYKKEQGGGSLRDYLGYGSTLATWFRDGDLPRDVTARVHRALGDEVDEQSVVIASYDSGLSTFQTRWGTFTDPWTEQPQPRCGFVIVGTKGTIASWDYADAVHVQNDEHPSVFDVPVDVQAPENAGGIANLTYALESGSDVTGPTSWQISFAGQRIVEAAARSADDNGSIVRLSDVA
ncbi:hypothetical protein B7R22_02475 [Subtercola boreus]|uniref:Uncharacterized protein n=1 Tax=Subtercola boreus TaxID=120213 RepID=A0A3E0W432_9MICO|nr:hypothetical protein B7R22_02475 [Subtercola boreus]